MYLQPSNGYRPVLLAVFLAVTLCLDACKSKEPAEKETAQTTIEWEDKYWNFGTISEGESVAHTFRFTNTGKHNLLIRNVETGCGCSTAAYDKAPVGPGKEGKIEIVFNSAGRYGKQYKEIRIFANIPDRQGSLKFTADVRQ